MISAATARSRPSRLETFQLALSLLADGQNTPSELRTYLQNVLTQANALIHNPRENIDQLPESIELAYEMQRILDVRRIVETILKTHDLAPEDAKKLLKQLEQDNARQERSSTDRILP